MTTTDDVPDVLRGLRERSAATGGIFWQTDRELMVFDATEAARVNRLNFADLTLPDRLADLLRRRPSTRVSWKEVRTRWLDQLPQLTDADGVAALDRRMDAVLHERAGQRLRLDWLAHEVSFRSLLPFIIDGLPERDRALIHEDAIAKIARLVGDAPENPPLWRSWRPIAVQVRAGLAVRRELRRRTRPGATPGADLTQPVVDHLLPDLGRDRTVDAVTAVLTAVAGPPGAAAACVMYALVTHPDWADRITAEFAAVSDSDLYRHGPRAAPLTHRFVKEVMRLWTSPTMLTRSARCPLRVGEHHLTPGQFYVVSPAMVHHDPRHWRDPDLLDPDRWLPGAPNGPTAGRHYVPFGWTPTQCIGAGLGLTQLVLLCRLLTHRHRIQLETPTALRMSIGPVPLPLNFTGHLHPRD